MMSFLSWLWLFAEAVSWLVLPLAATDLQRQDQPAHYDEASGTPTVLFDSTRRACASWVFRMPRPADAHPWQVVADFGMPHATTGRIQLSVQAAVVARRQGFTSPPTRVRLLTPPQVCTGAVPHILGHRGTLTCPLGPLDHADLPQETEALELIVCREGQHATDTALGDLALVQVWLIVP